MIQASAKLSRITSRQFPKVTLSLGKRRSALSSAPTGRASNPLNPSASETPAAALPIQSVLSRARFIPPAAYRPALWPVPFAAPIAALPAPPYAVLHVGASTPLKRWDPERWANAMHEELEGDLELEIGWTFAQEFWNRGYATEAAAACRDHAFGELGRDRVISLIARGNLASIRVAEKIGETLERRDIGGEIFKFTVDLYALEKTPAR